MTVAKRSTVHPGRQTKRNGAPACRREVAVYDGQEFLGIVKIAENITAYNRDGKRVGIFASAQAASDALCRGHPHG
jgi:hypothetical protein